MPFYKFTLVMSYSGYGWTESYIFNAVVSTPTAVLYNTYGQVLAGLRQNLLCAGASVDFVRISTVGALFSAQTFSYGVPGQVNPSGVNPNLAVLVRGSQQGNGPSKSIFIRGIPGTSITANSWLPTADIVKAFNNLTAYLTQSPSGNSWGWLGANEATKITQPISGYTVGDAFQVTVTIPTPQGQTAIFAGIPIGTKLNVRFTGINGKSELNGTQVVSVVSTTSCITKQQFGVIPWTHGGTCTLTIAQFNRFFNFEADRLTTRKAGKQLFLERGRSPVRVRT